VLLDWDATIDLSFSLKVEYNENDVTGRQQVISKATPTVTEWYQDCGAPNFKADFDWEQYDQSFDNGLFDDTESSLAQLTIDWAIGEHTLRSITSFTEYEFENALGTDYGPLIFLNRSRVEEHEQFSQEFLLTSPTGGFIEYLAGIYYQEEELTNDRGTRVIISNVPPIEDLILNSAVLGPLGLPSTSIDGAGSNAFEQDAESWSVFAELTFNITDTFRAIVGIRYSEDEKEMRKVGTPINITGILPDALFNLVWGPAGLNLATPHEYEKDRDEDHTTGNVNFQWDMTDEIMAYFNWATGYKAGGYDEDNSLGREFDETLGRDVSGFEDEEVDSFGIGAKIGFGDGRGRMNLAYFRSDYDDVQVSTFDGNAAFVVGNAAETEVEGFEFDVEYALTDSVIVNAAGAWLDASYKSFPDGACTEAQVQELIAAGGTRSSCIQDLSGKRLQYAPEYTFNFGIRYDTSLTDNLDLGLNLDYLWSDDVVIANDLDPELIQDSYDKINVGARLMAADGTWVLSLVGKNLGDEKTFTWGNDVPLAQLGFSETYYKHIDPPETWELSFRYNFY
jgi:outer membrane receptor protein involved in Fe transport